MAYEKFKLVYGAKNRDIKGSLKGIPAEEDPTIVTKANYAEAKLVYEKEGNLMASQTGIPASDDRVIGTLEELEGYDPEAAKKQAEKELQEQLAKEAEEKASAEAKAEPQVAAEEAEVKKVAKK